MNCKPPFIADQGMRILEKSANPRDCLRTECFRIQRRDSNSSNVLGRFKESVASEEELPCAEEKREGGA
jgi:hypothetical protein